MGLAASQAGTVPLSQRHGSGHLGDSVLHGAAGWCCCVDIVLRCRCFVLHGHIFGTMGQKEAWLIEGC